MNGLMVPFELSHYSYAGLNIAMPLSLNILVMQAKKLGWISVDYNQNNSN
jgi:hypothetical protein